MLPAAVSLETRVWLRYRDDDRVRGASRERGRAEAGWDEPPDGGWLDHVRGVARVLGECGRIPRRGFDVGVASDLPEASGLSSSAALQVAVAHALAAAAGAPFRRDEGVELARLCHRAETGFVGVPCGIMDQYAVACGESGRALLLDCAREQMRSVELPAGLALLVFDTGRRRELRDGAYERRVRQCDEARVRAGDALGRALSSLSELRPEELRRLEASLEPVALRRARHVVGENLRVHTCAEALAAGDLERAGAELYASHDSLARDYEVSWPEADRLVEASRAVPGIVGARMTGAGWGGCTVHLARAERAEAAQQALHDAFSREFGRAGRSWRLVPADGAGLLRAASA